MTEVSPRRDNRSFVPGLLLVLWVTMLPYLQVGGFDFINWDDPLYVLDNAWVKSGLTWPGFLHIWEVADPFPKPLADLTFMTEVALFGLDAGAFHWVGVAGHLINVALYSVLVLRLTGSVAGALLAAALFGVHPLRVEAVVWISEQKEIGANLFGLLALHAYLSHVRHLTEPRATKQPRFLAWAIFAHLASMLYKPLWVTMPVLLLLLDGWPLRRTGFWRLVLEKAGFWAIAGFFAILTLLGFDNMGVLTNTGAITPLDRLTNGIAAYGGFLATTVMPVNLAIYYPFIDTWDSTLTAWLAVMVAITLLTIGGRHRFPWWLMAWLWFLVAILPVSGIFAAGELVVRADRWSYLPHLGLLLALVHQVLNLRSVPVRRAVLALMVAAVPILALMTHQQVAVWQDSGTVWSHAMHVPTGQDSYYPRLLLGNHLVAKRQHETAWPFYQEAHRLAPDQPHVVLKLANLLEALGRMEEAWPHFVNLTTLAKSTPDLVAKVGLSFLLKQRHDEAVVLFQALLARWPHAAEAPGARFHLALAHEGRREPAQARQQLQVFLQPDQADYHVRCQQAYRAMHVDGFAALFPDSARLVLHLCPQKNY